MPFSFIPTPNSQASGDKRAGEASAQQAAKKTKLPPLADLVAIESAPKRPGASRLAAVAPLNMCPVVANSWVHFAYAAHMRNMTYAAHGTCVCTYAGHMHDTYTCTNLPRIATTHAAHVHRQPHMRHMPYAATYAAHMRRMSYAPTVAEPE